MTIDEAIRHCEEVAEKKELESGFDTDNERYAMADNERANCKKCAEEHRQLAGWLKELKQLRKQTKKGHWIPCSERLPKACRFVNCTCHSLIDNREDWVVETFYMPQPSGSPYSDWGNIPMLNDGKCEVVAWMYRNIPEPYKAESEDKE